MPRHPHLPAHTVPEQDSHNSLCWLVPRAPGATLLYAEGKNSIFLGFTVTCPGTPDSTGHHSGEETEPRVDLQGRAVHTWSTSWICLMSEPAEVSGNNNGGAQAASPAGSSHSRVLQPGSWGQLLTACLVEVRLPPRSKLLHAPVCRAEKGRAQPSPVSCPGQSGGDR